MGNAMDEKDKTIEVLKQQIHDNNNDFQVKYSALEVQNNKLKKALLAVINFEWNAWTEAKKLLEEIG
jgi:hypothetical protein